LLKKQKPIAVSRSAWWPGGRAETKTPIASSCTTASTAVSEHATAAIAAR
jgi:hypothetical protein